jgi:hypothetical protein
VNFDAVVVQFDEARGDGVLRDGRGREFYFHCVALADGSRVVDPGATVSARRTVGLRGRDEATEVVKL